MKIYWGTRAVAQVVIECLASMMKFWSNSQHSTKWAWWPAALEVQHGHLAWVWPSWPWMLSCLYHHSCCHCLGQEKNRTEQKTLFTLCFCMSCSYEGCWACSSTEGLSDGGSTKGPFSDQGFGKPFEHANHCYELGCYPKIHMCKS